MDELTTEKPSSMKESEVMLTVVFPGLVDAATSDGEHREPYFCIPNNVSRDEIRRAVGDFVLKAKNLMRVEGSVVVTAALSELYPCVIDDSASRIP